MYSDLVGGSDNWWGKNIGKTYENQRFREVFEDLDKIQIHSGVPHDFLL